MNHIATAVPPPRTSGRRLEAADIKRQASGRWREIIPTVCGIPVEVLDGKNHPCPSCGGTDRFAAFADFAQTGGVNCRGCHSTNNGDGLATIMRFRGVDLPEACRLVDDHLGGVTKNAFSRLSTVSTSTESAKPRDLRQSVDVDTCKPGHSGLDGLLGSLTGAIPTRVDRYRNAERALVGAAIRQDGPAGKTVKPASVGPDSLWRMQAMAEPRPLFRLPELLDEPGATVYVLEGEKAAEALRSIGLVATTWAGGSNADGKADWQPLAGRNIVLCCDNDDPGREAMGRVADTLASLSPPPTIRMLPPPDLADGSPMPAKGDAVEFIQSHADGVPAEAIAKNWLAVVEQTAELLDHPEAEPRLAWRPFPVDALPAPLADYAKDVARTVQVDSSVPALAALATAATAIGDSREIELQDTWHEPPTLFAAVVMPSGGGKSPATEKMVAPIVARDAEYQRINAELVAEFERATEVWKAENDEWKKRARKGEAGDPPEKPEFPALERAVVSDVTVEALAAALNDNPRGLLSLQDELSGFLGGFGRYGDGRALAERGQYLSIWSRQRLTIDRKTGFPRTIVVPRPLVSILGGVQPNLLHGLLRTCPE